MLLGLKVNRCSQNVMHTISKLVIIIFWPAILFLLLTLDLIRYKKSSPDSTLKSRDSEKERRQKYVRNFQTKDSLQRGEWIQVSNPINPYGFKGCNFSFHSWGKYAAKSMAERSAGVQLWVWKKFWEDYFNNVDVFRSYASRFLRSFGKDRTLLMVGDSHMEGQFLSLVCLLWSVNNTVQSLKPIQMQPVRKSIQFSPDYRPISFIRWDIFGNRRSGKNGEKFKYWYF